MQTNLQMSEKLEEFLPCGLIFFSVIESYLLKCQGRRQGTGLWREVTVALQLRGVGQRAV